MFIPPSSDLPWVHCVADNVLNAGTGENLDAARAPLDDNTDRFLQRCVEKGIVLNPDKMEYGVTSFPFMGHLLTSEGLKPDPEKISAILDMPTPADVAGDSVALMEPSTIWL